MNVSDQHEMLLKGLVNIQLPTFPSCVLSLFNQRLVVTCTKAIRMESRYFYYLVISITCFHIDNCIVRIFIAHGKTICDAGNQLFYFCAIP